jgi:hypothetical protein
LEKKKKCHFSSCGPFNESQKCKKRKPTPLRYGGVAANWCSPPSGKRDIAVACFYLAFASIRHPVAGLASSASPIPGATLAARLRRETTLTLPWMAARLQAGSWKSLAAKLHPWRKTHASPDNESRL